MKLLIILACVALSQAISISKTNFLSRPLVQPLLVKTEIEPETFAPYSFAYTADATDGASARQETADGNGAVRGSYQLSSADGIKRIVNYVADANGFRAEIDTNEPGTESKSAADTIVKSSQLPAEEIALKYGPRPDEKLIPGILKTNVVGILKTSLPETRSLKFLPKLSPLTIEQKEEPLWQTQQRFI